VEQEINQLEWQSCTRGMKPEELQQNELNGVGAIHHWASRDEVR